MHQKRRLFDQGAGMTEKKAEIKEIIFHNKENAYTIAYAESEEESFTALGILPGCKKGSTFILQGDFRIHPKYGEQFVFSHSHEVLPSSEEGIEGFLASGVLKGIGPKAAKAIASKFREDTFRIIEEEPERLTEVPGIGKKRAESIAEAFKSHKEFAEMTLYFQQFGISAEYTMKLYRVYGKDTIEAVKENPYRLTEDVFGIGFKKADIIAEKMGVAKDDESRIKSGIKFVLMHFAASGSTFVPQKELCEKAGELMDIESFLINDVLAAMAFEDEIRIEKTEGRNAVFLMPYFMAEQNVCKRLLSLEKAALKPVSTEMESLIAAAEADTGIHFSENQKYAAKTSINNGICVITGGPGTGKTTVINGIIKILIKSGMNVAVAAPTGRAAKRITETTGYEASTIHRLLEYYYSESEDAMFFGRNAENPLEHDAVIIDESSMIDLMLMNGLLNAIKPGTRLIMVGDSDQLPSVGAGNVLRDILESEFIYSVKLNEIFRQAAESLIVVNAHRINRGEYPDCNAKDKDFFMIRSKSEREVLDSILELCENRLLSYYRDLDPSRDIQVLTPVRKGLLGCVNLNKEIQSIINPSHERLSEKTYGEKIFRENDKVMQIKNNYMLKWKTTDDFTEGEGVFNGDVGTIKKIDNDFNELTVEYDGNRYVVYDFSQLDELEPAYAVTVHKSQGSEFPVVVIPISWFPPVLSTRNLLYTAVTRAKKAVIIVGSETRMQAMVDNNSIKERYSGLKARLQMLLDSEKI